MLKLESIRDDQRDKYWRHLQGRVHMGHNQIKGSKWLMGQRPFVKEVIGIDRAGRPVKRNVVGKKSYLAAVGTGARGVFYWFNLKQGRCYCIQEQVSRYRSKTYYGIVNSGHLHEVTEAGALEFVTSTRVVNEIRL